MEISENDTTKKRHGCLTVLLIAMIIANSVVGFQNIALSFSGRYLALPKWSLGIVGILGIINAICAIAIFRWKKWGFWGLCLSALVILIINLSLNLVGGAFAGFIGVLILYGVLQIGQENKGWSQLE